MITTTTRCYGKYNALDNDFLQLEEDYGHNMAKEIRLDLVRTSKFCKYPECYNKPKSDTYIGYCEYHTKLYKLSFKKNISLEEAERRIKNEI